MEYKVYLLDRICRMSVDIYKLTRKTLEQEQELVDLEALVEEQRKEIEALLLRVGDV